MDVRNKPTYFFPTEVERCARADYKSLLLFDLPILKLTSLPVLAPDSILFSHIKEGIRSTLIRLYTSFDKQTFVAVDRLDGFDKTQRK